MLRASMPWGALSANNHKIGCTCWATSTAPFPQMLEKPDPSRSAIAANSDKICFSVLRNIKPTECHHHKCRSTLRDFKQNAMTANNKNQFCHAALHYGNKRDTANSYKLFSSTLRNIKPIGRHDRK
jgi:hypothetical protein